MTALDEDLLAGLRNGSWLERQDFPPLKYAVPGLIPEGTTLLVGPPKIGKSWFVLACALATAAGGVVLDKITVTARPTLYLALEDGDRRMQSRCRMLLREDPIPAPFEYLTTVAPGRVVEPDRPTGTGPTQGVRGPRPDLLVVGPVEQPLVRRRAGRDRRAGGPDPRPFQLDPGGDLRGAPSRARLVSVRVRLPADRTWRLRIGGRRRPYGKSTTSRFRGSCLVCGPASVAVSTGMVAACGANGGLIFTSSVTTPRPVKLVKT